MKDLLDVADNLERALDSVPKEDLDESVALKVLSGLVDGVKITDQQLLQVISRLILVPLFVMTAEVVLTERTVTKDLHCPIFIDRPSCVHKLTTMIAALQVFKKNHVQKFKPEGDQFDPNKHNAMFQVPGTKENDGLVAAVTKVGTNICGGNKVQTLIQTDDRVIFFSTVVIENYILLSCDLLRYCLIL